MGFKNTALNIIANPIGIFEETAKVIKKATSGPSAAPNAPMAMPAAPKIEDANEKAEKTVRARRSSASQSIYTSPLGIGGEAAVAKKMLLGQ